MDAITTGGGSNRRADPVSWFATLCDPGTVVAVAHGGVVTATGRVAGRHIACYGHDARCRAGSVGTREAWAIDELLKRADLERLPVVSFVASAGARVHEGLPALDGFAGIFRRQVALSGRTLQVTVVCGPSAGGGCYAPALCDFVVMTCEAAMFLTGPSVVAAAIGERTTAEALGGARVHERNGVCDLVAAGDAEAADLVRRLLGYFPPQALVRPRAPKRSNPGAALPARARQGYDVRAVLAGVVDEGSLLELAPRWADNMVTGLARLAGRSVGVVANQPRRLGGILDAPACDKAVRLVLMCDRYGLPLLVFVDTPGFMPGSRQERAAIIRHGADLVRAFAAASVPRLTIVLRKAYGGAYIAMNSRELGADAVFAWRDAELGVMASEHAVELIHARTLATAGDQAGARARLADEYARERLSADRALSVGSIDAVIEPAETRARLRDALRHVTGHGFRSCREVPP
jgi:acetyl-CoA carboxylase carboxyltransferase component